MMMCLKNSVVVSFLMLIVFTCWLNANRSEAFGTFGFDIHHRYSDAVKEFLNIDGLPEEGTADYYSAMAHRDRHFMSRHLAASTPPPPLTFYGNNRTYNIWELGYLHYSLVRVGTPALTFLVALDTSSNLFWLPCDCTTCARNFNQSDGSRFEFDIYSPSNSTTSTPLPCNSTMCGPTRGCSARFNACSYEILNGNTSSTRGILVDDILHLGTDVIPQDIVDVAITFGCGKNQTGNFLNRINGVFGLGMGSISVPSILAKKNVTSNSFSVCFVTSGQGRIEFGDKGSASQKTTPFNLQQSNPTYHITVTQVAVGNNVTDLEFAANFDSGIRYTYFNDPAYSFITNNFNSRITEKPYHYPFDSILDYCYALSATQGKSYTAPNLTFTMKGGSQFNVTAPTILFKEDDGYVYCLAIVKSESINVIGQNFMTGKRLVFDREEMVLGWKESTCTNSITSNITPQPRPRPPPQQAPPPPPPPTSKNGVARLSSMTSGLMAVVLGVLSHNIIVLSS